MMLLNGGLLGLVHRDLPHDIRPSALDWRVGTLLLAGGSVLVAFQQFLPPEFMLPLGNGFMLVGLTLYWRSLRRFYGRRDIPWIFLPALFAVIGIYGFAAILPSFSGRVFIATVAMVFLNSAAAWTLRRYALDEVSMSRRVLSIIFIVTGTFMALRCVIFFMLPSTPPNSLDNTNLVNVITPIVVGLLPIIGTTAFLLLCSDRIKRRWERAASTDYLTGLANRRTIVTIGQERFAAAQASRVGFTVAVIDIDHFKAINDKLGHDIGDEALKHIARILEKNCRGPNMVGRHGGEEFVALFDRASAESAKAAAERLRAAVDAASLTLVGHDPLRIKISIGMGVMRAEDRTFDDVLRRADQALYQAKNNGRNRLESLG